MRKALTVSMVLLLASCGAQEERQSSEDLQTFDASDEAAPAAEDSAAQRYAPPGISPTAAPGVAFNYRYDFRLPGAAIGPVQEQHAAACEKLGTDRCRITGMRYTMRDEDGDEIDAELAFKLDPAIARAFGRQGIEAVTQADGLLTHAEITGTDVGSQIATANRTQAQMREELERIEARLAQRGLGASERAELQNQAAQLRQSLRGGDAAQAERREMLARTPVVFKYEAGDTKGTLGRALDRAGSNFVDALTVILVLAVTLLPFAIVLFAAWLLWRWLRRRFAGPAVPRHGAEVSPPEA